MPWKHKRYQCTTYTHVHIFSVTRYSRQEAIHFHICCLCAFKLYLFQHKALRCYLGNSCSFLKSSLLSSLLKTFLHFPNGCYASRQSSGGLQQQMVCNRVHSERQLHACFVSTWSASCVRGDFMLTGCVLSGVYHSDLLVEGTQ